MCFEARKMGKVLGPYFNLKSGSMPSVCSCYYFWADRLRMEPYYLVLCSMDSTTIVETEELLELVVEQQWVGFTVLEPHLGY